MGSIYRDTSEREAAYDGDSESAVMARNGITRIPAYRYQVDGYSYSNLADALAQVNRSAAGRKDDR